MSPGDRIRIHMHDTPAGLRVDMSDLTTGQIGSMTASIANGFGHILYQPSSATCHEAPYAFHPEYSTANPRGNTWSIHTYNVAMSDEIGHFENCLAIDANNNCTVPGSQDAGGLDEDDANNFCVPGTDSTLVMIDGCFFDDEDWDGQSYRLDWPGTNPNPVIDRLLHPTPVRFTSPTTDNGRINYSTTAFETDLPAIEGEDAQFNPPFCDPNTGANCVDPPMGAQFYPFYTTALTDRAASGRRAVISSPERSTTSVAARPPSTEGYCASCSQSPGSPPAGRSRTSTAETGSTPARRSGDSAWGSGEGAAGFSPRSTGGSPRRWRFRARSP